MFVSLLYQCSVFNWAQDVEPPGAIHVSVECLGIYKFNIKFEYTCRQHSPELPHTLATIMLGTVPQQIELRHELKENLSRYKIADDHATTDLFDNL